MANRSAGLISGLTAMVHKVKASISAKFQDFYLKRVYETDLAPTKTFKFEFMLGSNSTSTHRRSLAKLKGLLIRSLLKNNPVLALAANEYLPLENTPNEIRLNMLDLEVGTTMPEVNEKIFKKKLRENRIDDRAYSSVTLHSVLNAERLARSVIQSSVQYLELDRYLKYLQYLARKYSVPVYFKLQYNLRDFSPGATSVKYHVWASVHFVGWVPSDQRAENRHAAIQTGTSDDALFRETMSWTTTDIGYLPVGSKFHIAKFFLHLDKAVKVANTLSRKIDYGYNAFSFRTA